MKTQSNNGELMTSPRLHCNTLQQNCQVSLNSFAPKQFSMNETTQTQSNKGELMTSPRLHCNTLQQNRQVSLNSFAPKQFSMNEITQTQSNKGELMTSPRLHCNVSQQTHHVSDNKICHDNLFTMNNISSCSNSQPIPQAKVRNENPLRYNIFQKMINKEKIKLEKRTDYHPSDWYFSFYAPEKFTIKPKSEDWSITSLACFLNEINNFVKTHNSDELLLVLYSQENKKWKIYNTLIPTIEVKVSTCWLIDKWICLKAIVLSNKGKHLKYRQKVLPQVEHYFFMDLYNINDGTRSLFKKRTIIFNSPYDFSDSFHYFVKVYHKLNLKENDDNRLLFEYWNAWCEKNAKSVSTLDAFKQKVNGYLKLKIFPKKVKRLLPLIDYKGKPYYIQSGIYIFPTARSFLEKVDTIKGFLLDTTFKVIPYFKTAILMASSLNTGIALVFIFSRHEDADSYSVLLKTFQEQTGYRFYGDTIETDQGSAHNTVAEEFNMIQMLCLRHLLHSLQTNPYAYHAKLLIKSATQLEFDNVCEFLSNIFHADIEQEKK